MRLLSYKTPLRFNNLDIGGFSLATKCPFVFNNCTYKDIPFATKCLDFDMISSDEAHHVMLQNATAIFMMG
jgi:hypothetical protein